MKYKCYHCGVKFNYVEYVALKKRINYPHGRKSNPRMSAYCIYCGHNVFKENIQKDVI